MAGEIDFIITPIYAFWNSENSVENEVEKNWGVFYENRTPKKSFQNYLNYLRSTSD